MAEDFNQLLAQIEQDAQDRNIRYKDKLELKLQRAENQINRDPDRQSAYDRVHRQVMETRTKIFRNELERVRADVKSGILKNQYIFDEERNLLASLGEHDNRLNPQIAGLITDWQLQVDIRELQSDATRAINIYTADIEDGKDFNIALSTHLIPLQERIEPILQRIGENREVADLLAKVRRMIKDADKTRISTLALQGGYDRIIKDLESKTDDNYAELVVDSFGVVYGTLKRKEALYKYYEIAEIYASGKADDYLSAAKNELRAERIYGADTHIREALLLYQLPDKKKEEIQTYQDDYIKPQLKRIEFARKQLEAIKSASSLEKALELYKNALDENIGWPSFNAVEVRDANGEVDNTVSQPVNIVSAAALHIEALLDSYLSNRLAIVSDPAQMARITTLIKQDEMDTLAQYVGWGNGNVRKTHGERFTRLQNAYTEQLNQRANVKAAADAAQNHINNHQFMNAYYAFEGYATIVEQNVDLYPAEIALWNRIKALNNLNKLKLDVRTSLDAGYDATKLDAEIARFEQLRETIKTALAVNKDGAVALGLNQDDVDATHILWILHGLKLFESGAFDQAQKMWKNIPSNSPNYPTSLIENIDKRIRVDGALENAIAEGKAELNAHRLESAYEILVNQQDKTDARGYSEFQALFNEVRTLYANQLLENLKRHTDVSSGDSAVYEHLRKTLQKVSFSVYQNNERWITIGYLKRIAEESYTLALPTKNAELWRNAIAHYTALNELVPQTERLNQVWAAYTDALVNQALNESSSQNNDLAQAAAKLDQVAFPAINNLAINVPNSPLISLLRARTYNRYIQLGDSIISVRRYIQSVQTEVNTLKEKTGDTLAIDITRFEAQINQASALILLADRLDTTLVPEKSFHEWKNAIQKWEAIQVELQPYLGLMTWAQARLNNARERILRINPSNLTAELDRLARLSLLGQPTMDTQPFIMRLRDEAKIALNNTETTTASHYTELEKAAWALAYLVDPLVKLENLVDITDFNIDANPSYDEEEFVLKLATTLHERADLANKFQNALARIRGTLDTAKITGDFTSATQLIKSVSDGEMRIFAGHSEFQKLLRELDDDTTRYKRLDDLYKQIDAHFKAEQFDLVTTLLDELKKHPDAADGTHPSDNAKVIDSYAGDQTLTGARKIHDRIREKQAQIKSLENWLAPLITTEDLTAQIWFDDSRLNKADELNINLSAVMLVRFGDVDAQIAQERAIAHYDDALQLLAQADFGIGGTQDHPTYYDQGLAHYSLSQAYNCLKNCPLVYKDLKSTTARAIFKWAGLLYKEIRNQLGQVEERYADLDKAQQEFDLLFSQLIDDSNAVRATNGNGRAQAFDALEITYSKLITGSSSTGQPIQSPVTSPHGHYTLYPVAAEYKDAIQLYQEAQRYR